MYTQESLCLLTKSESVQDCAMGLVADGLAKCGVAEERCNRGRELADVARTDEPSIETVANDFFNSLTTAPDGDFRGTHRFKVNAAEAFVAAGKREQHAVLEKTGDFRARDTSEKSYPFGDLQFVGEVVEPVVLGAIADNLQREGGV